MPVIEADPDDIRGRLADAGAAISDGNTPHERWRATLGDAVAVAYDDSVVVQGRRPADILRVLDDSGGHVYLYFDGAARGNPGPAGVGWVIVTDEGIVEEANERIGTATNNEAEYEALIRSLEAALEYGFDTIEIRGDSELVIRQVTGEYDARSPHLRERRVRARELLDRFEEWSITAVPRGVNSRADELASEALDHG